MRDYADRCGIGGGARELVELAVVNVQQLVAAACDFDPCRSREKRPQANDRLVAAVDGEKPQSIARLVV